MFKKVKNLHLFILVLIISLFSLVLIKDLVLAQSYWVGPDAAPGYIVQPKVITSPLSADLDFNGFNIKQGVKDQGQPRAIDFGSSLNIESPHVLQIGGNRVLSYNEEDEIVEIPKNLKVLGNIEINGGSLLLDNEEVLKTKSLNIFVGINAGEEISTGNYNTFLGTDAGWKNSTGSANTFVGSLSGSANEGGENNTFLGLSSGRKNTGGDLNTFLGINAGDHNTTGSLNTFVGAVAGFNGNGTENTFIGSFAGYKNSKTSNTFVGSWAGYNNDGEGNIFIGYQAGYNDADGEDKLYITNSNTSEPLIYGDFYEKSLINYGMFQVKHTLDGISENLIYANALSGSSLGSLLLLQNNDEDKFEVDLQGNVNLKGSLKLHRNEYSPSPAGCATSHDVGNIYFERSEIGSEPPMISSNLYICVVRSVTVIDPLPPPSTLCSNEIEYSWEKIIDFNNIVEQVSSCGGGGGGPNP